MDKSVKKLISMVLAFIMLGSSMVFAQSSDYQGHWAESSIQNWIDKDYVKGYEDGSFKAENDITRAEFIALVNRSFEFTEQKEVAYTDVKESHWAYDEFKRASAAGYIAGFEDGTLRPNNKITRQEVAAIMARLLNLEEAKESKEFMQLDDFEKIPQWSAGAVSAIVNKGYMKLREGNSFVPDSPATRGEVIAALDSGYLSFVKVKYDQAGTYAGGLIDGSVEINAKDVILEDTIINGNLIIGANVGSGDVTLKKITVKGDTIVRGGGMNSIIIEDCKIENLIIEKKDGKIRILAKGSTYVDKVDMQSGGKLESQDGKADNFGYVVIAEDVASDQPIILVGNFEKVEVRSGDNEIQVKSGSIKNLEISKTAKDAKVNLAKDVKVDKMEVSAAATIAGEGEIGFAKINENGVKTIKPTAPIEKGKDVDQVEIVDPSPSPRPSGGGQSSGPSGIAVNTITLKAEKILLVAGGDTKTIEATIMPSNATNKTLTWTSTNENVAKVIDGVVTSLEAGEAIIEAKAGGKSARVSVVVKAATPEEDFEFDSDTRTITAYNNWGLQEVVIPVTIDGVIVEVIGEDAFEDEELTSVLIPNSVKTIGEKAFYENNLTSVVIPDSVETIKKRAFYDNKLSSVEIGNSVKTIGEAAFRENELTSLVIPDSVETIGERAFSKNALISITIPSSVTSMGPGVFNNNQLPVDQAFIYAMNLDGTQDKTRLISYGGKERDEVVIPDNVTTIGEIAFEYSELKSVVIPNSVVSIGSSAFRFNDLISVVISNSMTDIGEYAFYGNFLTSLVIPGSVETIGECAFYENTLTSVTIPSSVTNMGEGVFLSNRPDKNSENIPESDFVGTWRIVGTKWIRDTPLIKYAVTYDLNAGTGTVPIQADVAENVIFTVADPADLTGPEGKVFKEWNTLADGTGTAYAAGDSFTMGLEAVTLYAIWEDIT